MKLTHRLLVFAALGPAASFAVMTLEVVAVSLVKMAFGLSHPMFPLGDTLATIAHNALSPVFLILFALFGAPAALSGLAVDMAERHERTDPIIAIAAACAAVVLMSILPGFFTVLVFASRIGGVLAGLLAGAAAATVCWLVAPAEAGPAPPAPPRPIVIDPSAYRPGQPVGGFGRR